MAGELSLTRTYNRVFSMIGDMPVQDVIFDNISARTALLFRMREMGAIIPIGGAPHLRFTILKELPTTTGYTDLDPIEPVRPNPYTSCVYEWKQLQCPIEVSGRDMIITDDSDEAIENLLTGFLEAAEISMRDAIGGSTVGIFSDADESDLTRITGLQNFFTSSTTTGTVGQLSRATLTAWRHQSANVSSDFSANGLARFRTLYRQCGRHDEQVDTIVLNGSTMDNYENALTSTFQVNMPLTGSEGMLDAGFQNIRYKNAVVFPDDSVPANYGYFLNLAKYIRLYVRRGREAEIGDFVKATNKDALSTHVLWAGNMVTTNLARGGVLLNGDTD